uniref:uncharacterized protein LOC122591624 n=1 Tax=Erigeron canadensis TaxID=72917 RepID=UPI001CB8B29D|nr:uncharacterized protein LOC122591624 [Erigeron canadensis]
MVEVTNQDLVKETEKRLGSTRKGWVDEIPLVLWGLRTTPKRGTNETPFSLVYGSETVLPTELQVSTCRVSNLGTENNDENLRINLDILDERREIAVIRATSYRQKVESYYNKRVRKSTFKPGDYVLRLNSQSKEEEKGKRSRGKTM